MRRIRRPGAAVVGRPEAGAIAATLGGVVRSERRRRRLTQRQLGTRVGLSQTRISEIEASIGGPGSLETWVALGIALGRPLSVAFSRAVEVESVDAGHLAMEELVLRMVRRIGWVGAFELPTRPTDPSRPVDVCARVDAHRLLVVIECWNRFGDMGAAARSTARKVAEAEALTAASDRQPPYTVRVCWLIRPSAANRRLVRDHPEVFRSRFPGSSVGWTRAIEDGAEPPTQPGIAWLDVGAKRVVPIRLRTT